MQLSDLQLIVFERVLCGLGLRGPVAQLHLPSVHSTLQVAHLPFQILSPLHVPAASHARQLLGLGHQELHCRRMQQMM